MNNSGTTHEDSNSSETDVIREDEGQPSSSSVGEEEDQLLNSERSVEIETTQDDEDPNDTSQADAPVPESSHEYETRQYYEDEEDGEDDRELIEAGDEDDDVESEELAREVHAAAAAAAADSGDEEEDGWVKRENQTEPTTGVHEEEAAEDEEPVVVQDFPMPFYVTQKHSGLPIALSKVDCSPIEGYAWFLGDCVPVGFKIEEEDILNQLRGATAAEAAAAASTGAPIETTGVLPGGGLDPDFDYVYDSEGNPVVGISLLELADDGPQFPRPHYLLADGMFYPLAYTTDGKPQEGYLRHPDTPEVLVPVGLQVLDEQTGQSVPGLVVSLTGEKVHGVPVHPTAGWSTHYMVAGGDAAEEVVGAQEPEEVDDDDDGSGEAAVVISAQPTPGATAVASFARSSIESSSINVATTQMVGPLPTYETQPGAQSVPAVVQGTASPFPGHAVISTPVPTYTPSVTASSPTAYSSLTAGSLNRRVEQAPNIGITIPSPNASPFPSSVHIQTAASSPISFVPPPATGGMMSRIPAVRQEYRSPHQMDSSSNADVPDVRASELVTQAPSYTLQASQYIPTSIPLGQPLPLQSYKIQQTIPSSQRHPETVYHQRAASPSSWQHQLSQSSYQVPQPTLSKLADTPAPTISYQAAPATASVRSYVHDESMPTGTVSTTNPAPTTSTTFGGYATPNAESYKPSMPSPGVRLPPPSTMLPVPEAPSHVRSSLISYSPSSNIPSVSISPSSPIPAQFLGASNLARPSLSTYSSMSVVNPRPTSQSPSHVESVNRPAIPGYLAPQAPLVVGEERQLGQLGGFASNYQTSWTTSSPMQTATTVPMATVGGMPSFSRPEAVTVLDRSVNLTPIAAGPIRATSQYSMNSATPIQSTPALLAAPNLPQWVPAESPLRQMEYRGTTMPAPPITIGTNPTISGSTFMPPWWGGEQVRTEARGSGVSAIHGISTRPAQVPMQSLSTINTQPMAPAPAIIGSDMNRATLPVTQTTSYHHRVSSNQATDQLIGVKRLASSKRDTTSLPGGVRPKIAVQSQNQQWRIPNFCMCMGREQVPPVSRRFCSSSDIAERSNASSRGTYWTAEQDNGPTYVTRMPQQRQERSAQHSRVGSRSNKSAIGAAKPPPRRKRAGVC